jgi:hypothetical protein
MNKPLGPLGLRISNVPLIQVLNESNQRKTYVKPQVRASAKTRSLYIIKGHYRRI